MTAAGEFQSPKSFLAIYIRIDEVTALCPVMLKHLGSEGCFS